MRASLKGTWRVYGPFYDKSWSTILSIIDHLYRYPSSHSNQPHSANVYGKLGLKKHTRWFTDTPWQEMGSLAHDKR